MEVPPEVHDLCDKLKTQHGTMRAMDIRAYRKILEEAYEYHSCYYAYWQWEKMRCLVVYRKDRLPQPVEFMAFLQELFEDGQIQELAQSQYARHFVQGEPLYTVDSMSDTMGKALADYADKKDEVEQFDLDETSTGKRMLRHLRNGNS